jgi:hypothetical protein
MIANRLETRLLGRPSSIRRETDINDLASGVLDELDVIGTRVLTDRNCVKHTWFVADGPRGNCVSQFVGQPDFVSVRRCLQERRKGTRILRPDVDSPQPSRVASSTAVKIRCKEIELRDLLRCHEGKFAVFREPRLRGSVQGREILANRGGAVSFVASLGSLNIYDRDPVFTANRDP